MNPRLRSWRIKGWAVVSLLGLLGLALLLAGCSGGGRAAEAEAAPLLFYYDNAVMNTAGTVVLAKPVTAGYVWQENAILRDGEGRQAYAQRAEYHLTEAIPEDAWETGIYYPWQPVSVCDFSFYDVYGQLVHSVTIEAAAASRRFVEFYLPPSGELDKGFFLVNCLAEQGFYQLLDINGNLMAAGEAPDAIGTDGWMRVYAASGFIGVSFTLRDAHSTNYFAMYTPEGQPFAAAHDYFAMEKLYIYDNGIYGNPQLYIASYRNEQGRRRLAVLDGQGRVVQGNLLLASYAGKGRIEVTQGWGKLVYGLMDLQGNWLGQPEIPLYEEEPEVYRYDGWLQQEDLPPGSREYRRISLCYSWQLEDEIPQGTLYYEGRYEPTPGLGTLWDVLDETGQVRLSNLNWVEYVGNDVFIVRQGFQRGLMDIEGNWIFQESVFTELED